MAIEQTIVDTNLNTGGFTVFEQQSITRPANVTPYSAGDIIASGNPGTSYLLFDIASVLGGYVVYAKLTTTDTGLDTGDYRVHLLKTNSISGNNDNDAFAITPTENKDKYIASFDVTFAAVGGQNNAIKTDLRIPFTGAKGAGENKSCIIAIVEVLGTPTPSANSTVVTLELAFEQNVEGMQNGNAQPVGN